MMKDIPASTGKKEVPHKGKLIYTGQAFSGTFDVAFHEASTEKLIELEGRPLQLGPKGAEVEVRRPYQYFENGVPILASQIQKFLEYDNGERDPYADLPKTKTFDINEKRDIAECTLDPNDPTRSYGTVVPRESIDKYAVEKVHDEWEGVPAGYKALAEHLEKEKTAMLYPYSFGRGRKVTTVIAYPVRMDSKLYMLKRFCTGQLIFRHPLEAPADAQKETTTVAIPALRIRNRKQSSSL